jgi:PAS domain-containing protein
VVEASPNPLVLVGQSGQIEMVNRQTERMFGHDRSAGGRTLDRWSTKSVRVRSLRLIQWEGVNHVIRQKA